MYEPIEPLHLLIARRFAGRILQEVDARPGMPGVNLMSLKVDGP
jgi:hypothetical protein